MRMFRIVVIRRLGLLIGIAYLIALGPANWVFAANHKSEPATQREENGRGEKKGKAVELSKDARVNGYTITERNQTFLFKAINVRHPDTGEPLGGKHKLELVCEKIPYTTNLFFNKGNSESTRSKCLVLLVTPRIIIQKNE